VKLVWEVGRFPQAFVLARAATFARPIAPKASRVLGDQLESFLRENPYGRGIHWASGQEAALRLLALTFAVSAFGKRGARAPPTARAFHAHAALAGSFIDAELHYAQTAVYNNHLVVEAAGLEIAGRLRSDHPAAARWRRRAAAILAQESDSQIYEDG